MPPRSARTHVVQVLGHVVVHEGLPVVAERAGRVPLLDALGREQAGHEGLQAELGAGDVRAGGVHVPLVVGVAQEAAVQLAEQRAQAVRGLDAGLQSEGERGKDQIRSGSLPRRREARPRRPRRRCRPGAASTPTRAMTCMVALGTVTASVLPCVSRLALTFAF